MSTLAPPETPMLPDAPQPKLSPWRLLIALLVLIAIGGAAFVILRHRNSELAAQASVGSQTKTWFAPYVDATLTPTVAFQDPATNPSRNAVLGFIVAGSRPSTACTPTWGTYETLDGAATTMDLDRRVAQLRGQGGDAIISFGGQANTELAIACDRPAALQSAYRAVISRYDADTIDFDVEGTAVDNTAANVRRAAAVKAIQTSIRADKGHLAVWLTLPVTPQGLNPDALSVVRTMLADKVDLAGVNVMAMDFGVASAAPNMLGAITSSMVASQKQLAALYGSAGVRLDSAQVWHRLGITVMIGQNDVAGERLSPTAAKTVTDFAAAHGLGRVSMWSLNRDSQCGVTFALIGTHSNLCSGVVQQPLQFSKTFVQLRGNARATAAAVTPADLLPAATTATADDPAKSPYPIWQPTLAYRENYKVVWKQAVYIATFYSEGQTPDAVNVTGTVSPWRLIGPVLRTDRAPKIPTLPAGTYPKWSASMVFTAGNSVLYRGLHYRASWYTQGDVPGGTGQGGTVSPWKALYRIPGEPYDG
jgi:chitinase